MKSPPCQNGEPPVRRSPRLRRLSIEARGTPLIVGSLCLNFRTCNLLVGDRVVTLTPAEFELLYYLMSRPGQVLSSEQILRQVWQYPPGTGRPELIRAHIKNLRIKIERNSREPEYLKTIGRRGYTICKNNPSEA
jgi:DNA-binding response OmpR family regulator